MSSQQVKAIKPLGRLAIVLSNHPPPGYALLKPGKKAMPGVDLVFTLEAGWRVCGPKANSTLLKLARAIKP